MRGLHKVIILLAVLLTAESSWAAKPKLLVYVPTNITVREFQTRLQGQLPDLEIRAYGRIKDFERAIKSENPDALLSYPVVLESQSIARTAQGERRGSPEDNYVLVTLEKPLVLETLDGATIGVLDLLGRKRMPSLVSGIVGAPGKPKLKRVKRPEDLLSLLLLDMADSILVPERLVAELKKSSGTNLVTTQLRGKSLTLPSLGIITAGSSSKLIAEALNELDSQTKMAMGVDTWLQL